MTNTIMQLYSGGPFDILAPRARDISALDIAESLSKVNRYTGHTKAPYSVAQHSVLVSILLEGTGFEMEGLFHDAHECFTGDLSSPLKVAINETAYRLTGERVDIIKALEKPIDEAVALRFGLLYPAPQAVKDADLEALTIERRQLLHPACGVEWSTDVKARDFMLMALTADQARDGFLARYTAIKYREPEKAS